MTDLKGKTALITGSTSGIGRATAVALGGRGAHVLVTGRNEQRAAEVVAEIERGGGIAAFRLSSLGDVRSHEAAAGPVFESAVYPVDRQRRHTKIQARAVVARPFPDREAGSLAWSYAGAMAARPRCAASGLRGCRAFPFVPGGGR
jgi:NAD(P)-dependent dehydrogenase (short-subunit alcohol dehydrogenase family)